MKGDVPGEVYAERTGLVFHHPAPVRPRHYACGVPREALIPAAKYAGEVEIGQQCTRNGCWERWER